MKIKAYNNIVAAKLIDETQTSGGIVLPDNKSQRFVKLEVLDVGELVEFHPQLKKGDKVVANALFEIFDPKEKIGFINSKDILASYE